RHLFEQLLAAGGPEQKTIIFCTRDRHADEVAAEMNNLYADWCRHNNRNRAEPYAFKCTAASSGNDYLADLRGASRRYFIATTVDLLTTGVDVPCVRNIVFFKYVRSPISFYQMVGRGTRLHAPDGKLMFRVYDYTNATRLFGKDFVTKPPRPGGGGGGGEPKDPIISVEGFEVHVKAAGRYVVTEVDGKAMPVTVEQYKERLAEKLVAEVPTLEKFRAVWVKPPVRRELLSHLPDAGRSALLVRDLEDMSAYDLYDVLAELGYGLAPKTRTERADAFAYKHKEWLNGMPQETAEVIRALTGQFAQAGTEGLENPAVFQTPGVMNAGGLDALRSLGRPSDVLMETKNRMFAT
ncbi:MAG TPA: helicase-related protein, partial [Elusimicrobiales bacterium]|nr:helicase-related protein [Elusimicrobiales bacterium]